MKFTKRELEYIIKGLHSQQQSNYNTRVRYYNLEKYNEIIELRKRLEKIKEKIK